MFNRVSLYVKLFVFVVLVALLVAAQPHAASAMGLPVAPPVPVIAAVGPVVVPPVILADTSFSVDASAMLDMAASIFNALWPVFGMVVGIILGIGLVTLLVTEIRKAI